MSKLCKGQEKRNQNNNENQNQNTFQNDEVSQKFPQHYYSDQLMYRNYQHFQASSHQYLPIDQQYHYTPEQMYYNLNEQYYYPLLQDIHYHSYPYSYQYLYDYYNYRSIIEQNFYNNKIKQEFQQDKTIIQQDSQKFINTIQDKLKIEVVKKEELDKSILKESQQDNYVQQNSQDTQNDKNNAISDLCISKSQFQVSSNVKTEEINPKIEETNNKTEQIQQQKEIIKPKSEEIFQKTEENILLIKQEEARIDCQQIENEKSDKKYSSSHFKKVQINDDNSKCKQSISKNNIRNFLTPIVRMKSKNFDFSILKNQNIPPNQFQAFLKKYFYQQDQTRLNIRQSVFDSLLNPKNKNHIQEKKAFALIALKNSQNSFQKLILEKKEILTKEEIIHQFEWMNIINDQLITFLNSIKKEN